MFKEVTTSPSIQPSLTSNGIEFFSQYRWCLNPFLTFADLWARIAEVSEHLHEFGVPWQQEEAKTNLYLLACAINCTAEDYLGRVGVYLKPLERYAPALKPAVRIAERILNVPALAWTGRESGRLWWWKARG